MLLITSIIGHIFAIIAATNVFYWYHLDYALRQDYRNNKFLFWFWLIVVPFGGWITCVVLFGTSFKQCEIAFIEKITLKKYIQKLFFTFVGVKFTFNFILK